MLILKFGGGKDINLEALAKNAAELQKSSKQIIIVTGANAKLSEVQQERGIEPKMITSERGEQSRFTDAATLELLKEIYGGVADGVAKIINENGGEAVSQLASKDSIILAKQHGRMRVQDGEKVKVIEGDLTGSIQEVNAAKIEEILESGKILVTTPPAATEDGKEVNVDGDKIAAAIAKELKADKLIFFADTPGLLEDVENEETLIKEIPVAKADEYAVGRMKKKVLAAKRAIEAGVQEVIFADGRAIKDPIGKALGGGGTRVF
ncbi:MAG: [LysW]-aminoadipate kinase [Patescibacteria group bacterium]